MNWVRARALSDSALSNQVIKKGHSLPEKDGSSDQILVFNGPLTASLLEMVTKKRQLKDAISEPTVF